MFRIQLALLSFYSFEWYSPSQDITFLASALENKKLQRRGVFVGRFCSAWISHLLNSCYPWQLTKVVSEVVIERHLGDRGRMKLARDHILNSFFRILHSL